MNSENKKEWLKRIHSQYSLFGVVSGLEITALACFLSIDKLFQLEIIKYFYIGIFIILIVQITLILLMFNAEREVAFGNKAYACFECCEKWFRLFLIFLIIFGWILILSLPLFIF